MQCCIFNNIIKVPKSIKSTKVKQVLQAGILHNPAKFSVTDSYNIIYFLSWVQNVHGKLPDINKFN